jgi:hypothetical protein
MTRRHSSITHLFLIAMAAGLLLAGTHASAQRKATVNIPFAFTANHQAMPAGHYTLELLSDRFLSFTDSQTWKHHSVIMVQPESGSYIDTRSRLRFLVSGDRYYLTEVRFAGSSMLSKTVIQRPPARELAKNQQTDSSVEIPAE